MPKVKFRLLGCRLLGYLKKIVPKMPKVLSA